MVQHGRLPATSGGRLDDLVSTTTWLVDRAWREPVTRGRRRWLAGPAFPTNTLVIVVGLGRPAYFVEISG